MSRIRIYPGGHTVIRRILECRRERQKKEQSEEPVIIAGRSVSAALLILRTEEAGREGNDVTGD